MTVAAGAGQRQGAGAPSTAEPDPAPDVRRGGTPEQRSVGGPRSGQPGRRPPIAVARLVRLFRYAVGRYWTTTRGRLRLARAVCLLLGAGLVVLIAVAATGLSTTWDAIEHRAAPRTVAATQLNLALNDMDAQAANILLSSGNSGTGRLDQSYSKASGFYRDVQQTISGSLRTLGAASEGDKATEDTVVALSRSKAIGYDANADESRFLLDAARRDTYEKSFFDKSQQLYGLDGASLATYDAKLAGTWSAYRRDHSDERFTGEYRRELDNITFAGEREAAEKTVEAYAVYQKDDRTFRRLVAEGKLQEATVFCIGWSSDTSNAHFGDWMKALDQVTGINAAHHETAIATGRDAINTQASTAAGALILAAGLLVLGLRPRLAEFR
ncbi:hypothetical protein [Streptomyces sp. NPDC051994]|uniref:hypothetical protein n=1 Tax=unclassified Streptomyces TaxID=2593676 RepID=UPI003430D7CC